MPSKPYLAIASANRFRWGSTGGVSHSENKIEPRLAAAIGLILARRPAVQVFARPALDVGLGRPVGVAGRGDDFVIAHDQRVGNMIVDQRAANDWCSGPRRWC